MNLEINALIFGQILNRLGLFWATRAAMTTQPQFQGTSIRRIAILHSFGVRGDPLKFVFFFRHKRCTTWLEKRRTALEKRFQDIVRTYANMWVLLKDGCGMRCTPVPNLLEINTLHTTICSALKWSQSISGVALMPLAPMKVVPKRNVLDVQNSLQAVPQAIDQNCGCGSGCG